VLARANRLFCRGGISDPKAEADTGCVKKLRAACDAAKLALAVGHVAKRVFIAPIPKCPKKKKEMITRVQTLIKTAKVGQVDRLAKLCIVCLPWGGCILQFNLFEP